MVMLIKCWQQHRLRAVRLMVVLTTIGWIVGGAECIKNGGGEQQQHHHQHEDIVDAIDNDGNNDDGESSEVLRNEGRQAKELSFFPTENTINQYDPSFDTTSDSYPQQKSYTDLSAFKFSNDVRQNYIESNYDQRPTFNSGELRPDDRQNADTYDDRPNFNSGQYTPDDRQNYASGPNNVVYGQYQYDARPQPPPAGPGYYGQYSGSPSGLPQRAPPSSSNSYAQNFNYISNNDNNPRPPPQRYPNRPPPVRPSPPGYTQSNYRPSYNYNQQQSNKPPPNYAGNYNVYQPQSQTPPSGTLSITDFISNLGQSASNLFNGGRPQAQHPQYASNAPGGGGGGSSNGGGGGGPNPVGQFANAIEAITKHDDLQCIPKIICQMVGGQRRQNSVSPLLGSPVFSSLISAVPSTSVGLVYGRAALLGYTAGENRCDGAYPKCPRSENNLLYYLNNHRGGFFRFFNGGAAYGDAGSNGPAPSNQQSQQNYQRPQGQYAQQQGLYNKQQFQQNQQQPQYQQQTYQQQQDSTSTNLAFLTGLADAINNSGGINLSNLGANAGVLGNIASLVGGMATGGAPSGFNVGDVFSNLLTGFVGDRFASRRISKRSVDAAEKKSITEPTTSTELDPLMVMEKEMEFVKKTDSKKRNLDSEMKVPTDMEMTTETPKDKLVVVLVDENDKEEILAEDDDEETPTESNETDLSEDGSIEGKIVNDFDDSFDLPEGRIVNHKRPIYSSNKHNLINFPTPNTIRNEKKVKFVDIEHLYSVDSHPSDVLIFQSSLAPNSKPFINEILRFPDGDRGSKRIKFEHKESPPIRQSYVNAPLDRIKMVFPDRTGTGNLRFDNKDFEDLKPVRFGRILSGIRGQSVNNNFDWNNNYDNHNDNNDYNHNNYNNNNNKNRNDYNTIKHREVQFGDNNNHPNYNRNYNYDDHRQELYNRYQSTVGSANHQPSSSSSASHNNNRGTASNDNVYVTNSKGIVEYYITAAGNKVYV